MSLFKRISFVFLTILMGALVLEGATRFFLSAKIPEPVVPNVGQFDDMLGWSNIPLARGVSNRVGYNIEYRINSKGLRDDETSYEKPTDLFRIVLLGDSYTFGYGVPIDKHFSVLLEGYFENVEVINMGVNAFGIDQALIYLREEGLKYKPDLVLAYVPHYSEHRHMYTNRFGKDKPRFRLIDGELVLLNSPVVDNLPIRPLGPFREIHRWLSRQSQAYTIFRNGFLGFIRPGPSASQQKRQDEQDSVDEVFMDEMYELGESIVYAMYEESLRQGATFVLVTQLEELHTAVLERQILSLDVTKSLSNPSLSLPHNLKHINEAGNGVLAWEIAKYLESNRLIPTAHLKNPRTQ